MIVAALARSVWCDIRRALGAPAVYEVLFKLLEAWLFIPAVAAVLSAVLSRAGHIAVSNRDAIDFLLSPSGLVDATIFGMAAVALLLKLDGSDRDLAQEVARLVREHGFESDCLVTSFNHDALLEMKRQDPRLRTGLIVAHALGDVSRLEVEALSVRADGLSDETLRAAHRLGQEVHVWTVNDARQMDQLIKRGVDNIITDDPDLLIRIRAEWARLTGAERLLLASRLLLGLDR